MSGISGGPQVRVARKEGLQFRPRCGSSLLYLARPVCLATENAR